MSKTQASETVRQEIEIDFFSKEDAPGIVKLFREVYGEGYPIKTYYIPDKLIEENASGQLISSVARTPSGEVIAHNALVLMDSKTHIYENAAGAVLAAFRGQSIFASLFKHTLFNSPKRFRIDGIVGEPVCSHTHVQKMCLQLGYKESGLEVDLIPSADSGKESGAINRTSVLLGSWKLKPRVQTVQIPVIYRDELEFLYDGLEVERTFIVSQNGLPADGSSNGSMKLFEFAQAARITVDCIGPDFDQFIARLESEAREKSTMVFQIWLPLASPSISAATDILREHGYFLGGVLPCGPNGDSLLMQKLSHVPDWERIGLFSERARKITEIIKRDRQSVSASV